MAQPILKTRREGITMNKRKAPCSATVWCRWRSVSTWRPAYAADTKIDKVRPEFSWWRSAQKRGWRHRRHMQRGAGKRQSMKCGKSAEHTAIIRTIRTVGRCAGGKDWAFRKGRPPLFSQRYKQEPSHRACVPRQEGAYMGKWDPYIEI